MNVRHTHFQWSHSSSPTIGHSREHLFSWGEMGWLFAEFLGSVAGHREHALGFSVHGTDTSCGLRRGATGLLLSNAHYILEKPGHSQVMILEMASRKKNKTGKKVSKSSLQEYEGLSCGREIRPLPVLEWLRGRPVALWERWKLCFRAEPGSIKGFSYGNDAQEICQMPCWSMLSTGCCCSVS